MKKYKYQRLTKEEKKLAEEKFYKTEMGQSLKKRYKRILIYAILIIMFGIFLLIEAFFKKDSVAQYIYSTILIITGLSFIILRAYIKMKQINDFITNKKN